MLFTLTLTILIAIACSVVLLSSGLLGFTLVIFLGVFLVIYRVSAKNNLLIPFLWLTIPVVTLPLNVTDMGGNKINQLFLGLLMIFGIRILWQHKTMVIEFLKNNKVLVILVFYTFMSIAWSDYKSISIRRFILFLGTIEMAFIIFIQKNKFEGFLNLIFYFLFIFSILSLGAVFLFPHYGISSEYGGAWKGITSHKNSLGAVAGIAVVFLIFTRGYFKKQPRRFMAYMLLFLSGLLLLESRSATSLLITLTILLFSFFVHIVHNQRKFAILYGFLGLLCFFVSIRLLEVFFLQKPFVDIIFSSLNKTTTLTGRTEIWPIMLDSIKNHPFFGGGYESFWIGPESVHDPHSPSYAVFQLLGRYAYEAHNGYIDVLNELGIVGLLLLLAFIINLIVRIFNLWEGYYEQFFLFINLTFFIIFCNFVETSFMRSSSLYWLLILFIYFLSEKNPLRKA